MTPRPPLGEYCASSVLGMTRRTTRAADNHGAMSLHRSACPPPQKSKEEKKKKKKHKHGEKEEDLMGSQADEPVVQSEETNEVAEVAATSTSAEVCVCLLMYIYQAFSS